MVIVVSAPHRKPAFEACFEAINRLKATVPDLEEGAFRRRRRLGGRGSGIDARESLLAWSCLSSSAAACCSWPQDEPVLRVRVNLVHLLVTAKDAARQSGGKSHPRRLQYQRQRRASKDRPSSSGKPSSRFRFRLLIDNSGSTAKDLKFEVDSVSRFVRALFEGGNDTDRAALYSFNYQVVKQTAFTRQRESYRSCAAAAAGRSRHFAL